MSGVVELKPCPFCGSEAELSWKDTFGAIYKADQCFVTCKNIACGTETKAEEEPGCALALWNRRSPSTPAASPGGMTEPDVMDEHVLNLLKECNLALIEVYNRCDLCSTFVRPTIARLAITITALEREASALAKGER